MSACFAQTAIKGVLFEKGTKNILKETNIFIMPYKLKAVTDSEGKFLFPDVPEGKFEFIVNKSGYIRLTLEADTKDYKTNLYLEKEYYDVFETVVTGKEIKKDVAKKSISQKDFLKAPGAQEDPVRAVQNLPGVANQTFSSQIVIQGSEPDDTRYTINGHEIPLIFHFGGLTSVVTPTAVKDVEFLAAGFGPEYGRASGGIINLNTRSARTDRWHGEGFIDITKLGVLTEGPINEKSSLIASARISYFGRIFEKIAEEMDDFAVTAAPEFQDYYVNYDYDISNNERFSLIALSSKDTLELIIKEGDDPNIEGDISNETTFSRVIPRYIKKINDKTKIDVSLAAGKDNLNFSLGERFFDLDTTSVTQRSELEYKYSDKLTNYIGTDIQWRKFNLDLLLPNRSSGGGVNSSGSEATFASIDGENTETAIYLRNIYKYDNKLTLSPNIRAEYFSTTEKSYLMPRVNATYGISSSLFLNFATGLYYQAPQNGENSEEFGNPDVEAEKSTHYLLSVVKDFREGSNKGLTIDVGIFYKELDDLIVSTSERRSDGTSVRNNNDGEGTVQGVQFQGSYKFDEYTFLTSYTYLNSRRNDPESGEYPSQFDQTHNLNFIGIYERSRWSFSTRLRYVSGGPYTPIEGAIYDGDSDVYLPTRGDFYSERFDDFFQLDFRVDRKFIYKTWILSAYLDIQNLTNANNGQGISYSYDYSQKEKAAGTPILPIFGLRGEF
jgi:hypothetical protein